MLRWCPFSCFFVVVFFFPLVATVLEFLILGGRGAYLHEASPSCCFFGMLDLGVSETLMSLPFMTTEGDFFIPAAISELAEDCLRMLETISAGFRSGTGLSLA